jgi:hypothetical protein
MQLTTHGLPRHATQENKTEPPLQFTCGSIAGTNLAIQGNKGRDYNDEHEGYRGHEPAVDRAERALRLFGRRGLWRRCGWKKKGGGGGLQTAANCCWEEIGKLSYF